MSRKPELEYKELTKAQYDALTKKYNNVLYFIYDTQQLFKGDIEWCPSGSPGPGPEPSSNDFVVNYIDHEEGIYTADKTFEEIEAAMVAEKKCKSNLTLGRG